MVIHNSFLDKIRSNIYIYIYIYRARGLKRLISALGITLLAAVFCGTLVVGNQNVIAESSSDVDIVVEMNDISIDVTIPQNTVRLVLDPTASLETSNLNVQVSTDAPYGYTLTMTADSSNLTRTTALDGVYPTIPTLAADSTQVGFAANHWGWKLPDDTKWHPFNPAGVTVGSSEEPVTSKTETISFAAKANSNTPTGTYKLTTTFAATANSRPLSITDVVYMQDFKEASDSDKSSILSSMNIAQSYELEDNRDGRKYYVAKLADGNIWMVQNLRIGQDSDTIALTPANSDVNENFTLNGKLTSPGRFTYSSVDGTRYQNNSSQYYCTDNYGCYYNWYTATAGAGTTAVASGDVNKSICPAGWTLPTTADYVAMAEMYNNNPSAMLVNPTSATDNSNGSFRPGLVLGGVYDETGFDSHNSGNGTYWARSANSTQDAYFFNINTSSINASAHWVKFQGRSLRCLVR